ncbi:TerB family tellurite resistance protein [Aliiglaciecola sp. 2_MG-2023]|uniref:tellurite resistance TerB family protein n=1 Tax=unclassified Aliiglaciecola TaxID=2593648 RepID=UPI0026E2EB2A|nr:MULTISPECIES: TerB family tellurite resistance protein [unclassified Aliiglaciecola]MDO6711047.1 TerB family tellurite resistance protein [Aliiglaciecola sp. 2_MG-2023]MDO6751961.1 TerB family tellurite resistance protein [Aliiglaciecola sp. 1_MG-2023]
MEQSFNEALLKLCMLLYRIDGKITLSEQDYYDSIFHHINWQGEEDMEEFQRQSIHQVREVVENGEAKKFVMSLKDPLSFNAKKALALAQGICLIDGEIADQEQEILDYLKLRVLAKFLDKNDIN